MKKIVVILAIFVFFIFAEHTQAANLDFVEKIVKKIDTTQLEKTSIIFADSSYSKPTHNFSPEQTVYIRVETVGNGDKQKTLLLLDSSKKEIFVITLGQSGNGPYIFTVSFKAPNQPGIYYVDIKIDSGSGSVYSSQQNINVGESQSSTTVVSEAKSEVKGASSVTAPTAISPTVTETPTAKEQSPLNFVTRFFNFLKRILASLTF